MEYSEIEGDIFEYEKDYYLTQCISSDFKMAKGIAKEFVSRYNLKEILLEKYKEKFECIWENQDPLCDFTELENAKGVFSLITKKKFFNKPTYTSLENSLESMKEKVIELFNKSREPVKIAMPKIGCGLDKLEWNKVKQIILNVFKDVEVTLLFVYC